MNNNSSSEIDPADPKLVDCELADNWEWMVATAEEITIKQDLERSLVVTDELKTELKKITRASNSIQIRGRLIKRLKETSSIGPQFHRGSLDAQKRDRIMRDLIRQHASGWLPDLLTFVPSDERESIEKRWHEQKYKKNICGEMSVLAFRASGPGQDRGLDVVIVADILWSIAICLSKEFTLDDDYIVGKVLTLASPLIELWDVTIKSTGSISEREGRLTSQWEEESRRNSTLVAQRVAVLRESGQLARFNDGPNDQLRQRQLQLQNSRQQSKLNPQSELQLKLNSRNQSDSCTDTKVESSNNSQQIEMLDRSIFNSRRASIEATLFGSGSK